MSLRVAGGTPEGMNAIMRMPLTRYTLLCEEYLRQLVAAKEARDKANRKRTTTRHGRGGRH